MDSGIDKDNLNYHFIFKLSLGGKMAATELTNTCLITCISCANYNSLKGSVKLMSVDATQIIFKEKETYYSQLKSTIFNT